MSGGTGTPERGSMAEYFAGIDIGSSFSKAVIFSDSRIISWAVIPTAGSHRLAADEVVSQVLLAARKDKTFTLAQAKLRTAWQGNARIRLDDRRVFDVCGNNEILTLPATVASGATVNGWLAFVIESSQVELAKQHKWCVAVVDQKGRQYKSRAEQDQSIG